MIFCLVQLLTRTGFMVTTVAETVEQANEMELENLPSLHLWP